MTPGPFCWKSLSVSFSVKDFPIDEYEQLESTLESMKRKGGGGGVTPSHLGDERKLPHFSHHFLQKALKCVGKCPLFMTKDTNHNGKTNI